MWGLSTSSKAGAIDGLELTVVEAQQGALVHLRGRLSIDSSPELRERILAILQRPSPQPVLVDMSNVSYVDCSGIATLIEGLKIARNRGTSLRLTRLPGRMQDVLEVTGIWALFQNHCEARTSSIAKVL
jgi:anti-sigma B factor antagonist